MKDNRLNRFTDISKGVIMIAIFSNHAYYKFGKIFKLYWLLLIQINNDLNLFRGNYEVKVLFN